MMEEEEEDIVDGGSGISGQRGEWLSYRRRKKVPTRKVGDDYRWLAGRAAVRERLLEQLCWPKM
jgi:hypothetical protein